MNPRTENRWQQNRRHWETNLDTQNLKDGARADSFRRDLRLYGTADIQAAQSFLSPKRGQIVLDLGGGLGVMAVLLGNDGAHVVIADISAPRLRRSRQLLQKEFPHLSVSFVVAKAEDLPFPQESFHRQFTKSVLIHTDLKRSAREIARTLKRGGRAVYIEPTVYNPFVNLYRRLLAPSVWAGITDYFRQEEIETVRAAHRNRQCRLAVERYFFLSFFAAPFNFLLKWPVAYRLFERGFMAIDRFLFFLFPALKQRAWFCLIKIVK